MDFNEWFYQKDDYGIDWLDYISSVSSGCDNIIIEDLVALVEKAYNIGYEQGVHMTQVDGPEL
jgi:hypothetical protein